MNYYSLRYIFTFILFFLSALDAAPAPSFPTCSGSPILVNETNSTISGVGALDVTCYNFKYSNTNMGGSVTIYYSTTTSVEVLEKIDSNTTYSGTIDNAVNYYHQSGPLTMSAGQDLNITMDAINNNQEYAIIIGFTPNIQTVNDSYLAVAGTPLNANVLANDNNITNIYVDTNNSDVPNIQANGYFTTSLGVGDHNYSYTATDGTNSEEGNVTITVIPNDAAWPSTCYSYYYRQGDNINYPTSVSPSIAGTFNTDQNISVTVYIKNLPTDYNTTIPSMYLTIQDPGSDLNLVGSSILYKSTPTAANQYFFTEFKLEPQTTNTIDVPLDMNLTISGQTGRLGYEIPQCGGNTDTIYSPFWGAFNVSSMLSEYEDDDYYNLPTQTTERFEPFRVTSYSLINNTQTAPVATMVGIEIIDTAGQDINIACQDQTGGRSLTDRLWIPFSGNNDSNTTSIEITSSILQTAIDENPNKSKTLTSNDFYKVASKNAAYRITYYGTADDELLQYETAGNRYTIENFPDVVQDIGTCVDRVLTPVGNSGNLQDTILVAVACGNAGNRGITYAHLQACLECLHGKQFVCSRDNFAIRPEAFMMQLKDQNQANPTSQTDLTTLSNSGSTGATVPPILHLATGYSYNLEVNATNHIDNASSPGYTTDQTPAVYDWNGSVALNCNDTENHTNPLPFTDGSVDTNASLYQVGQYNLHILDTTWTSVDSNSSYYGHHSNSHFASGPDCISDNSTVALQNADAKNGCNISSQHTNANTSVIYNNYDLISHPYKFVITNTLSVGAQDSNITAKPFVYIANIENNESISVHLNTSIHAKGYNDLDQNGNDYNLSNYTGEGAGCYAKDTLFGIGKSSTTSIYLPFRYRTHDLNASGDIITTLTDTNNSVIAAGAANLATQPSMTIPATYWRQSQEGVLSLRTNMNFDRNASLAVNPEDINYTNLDSNDTVNTFYADLINNKYAEGNLTVGEVVHHYYGKTYAPKVTILCKTLPCTTGNSASNANNTQVLVYFSVYCNPREHSCVQGSNLPVGSIQANDIRWWLNNYHDMNVAAGIDGQIGSIYEPAGNVSETSRALHTNNYIYETVLQYNSSLPYDALMQMQSSPWLIYSENNESAITNPFTVEFMGEGDWSGQYEEDSTTQTQIAPPTDRRIMW